MVKIQKKKSDKVFVYIDAENIRNTIEGFGYTDFNYRKLYNWLKENKKANRIYLYAAVEQGDIVKENKYLNLKKLGYYVSLKRVMSYKQKQWPLRTNCPHCKKSFIRKTYIKDKKKANCDVELTLDVIRDGVRKKYLQIIVFSCDGDFTKVYEYVKKDLKKKVTVYATHDKRTALKIKQLAKNNIVQLENIKGLLLHYGQK